MIFFHTLPLKSNNIFSATKDFAKVYWEHRIRWAFSFFMRFFFSVISLSQQHAGCLQQVKYSQLQSGRKVTKLLKKVNFSLPLQNPSMSHMQKRQVEWAFIIFQKIKSHSMAPLVKKYTFSNRVGAQKAWEQYTLKRKALHHAWIKHVFTSNLFMSAGQLLLVWSQ